jgi:hypothetical protein
MMSVTHGIRNPGKHSFEMKSVLKVLLLNLPLHGQFQKHDRRLDVENELWTTALSGNQRILVH